MCGYVQICLDYYLGKVICNFQFNLDSFVVLSPEYNIIFKKGMMGFLLLGYYTFTSLPWLNVFLLALSFFFPLDKLHDMHLF